MPCGQPLELALLLEGRVDQHQAALLREGGQRLQRLPAVAVVDRNLRVAAEGGRAASACVIGVQLAGQQVVLRPQQAGDQGRGAGVARRRPGGADQRDVVGQRPVLDIQQPADAAPPFAGPLGLGGADRS